MVEFTVPIYTAIAELTSSRWATSPSSSSPTSGSTRPPSPACSKRQQGQGVGHRADRRRDHRRLPPLHRRHLQPVDPAVHKIHDQYDKQAPFDGNVEYGMANAYTLVQALQAAGKNLTRQTIINAINQHGAKWTGPGLVPYRYSQHRPRRLLRHPNRPHQKRQNHPHRHPPHHHARPRQPDHPLHHAPTRPTDKRRPHQLTADPANRSAWSGDQALQRRPDAARDLQPGEVTRRGNDLRNARGDSSAVVRAACPHGIGLAAPATTP